VGGRIQHLHLLVTGNYNLDYRDDAYRANYDYVAPLVGANVASQTASRVNAFVGFGVGTAMLFSDRQGKEFHYHQIPFYGSFEGGLLLRLTEGLEARVALSWVPPVDNLNVLTPQIGLRAQF